MAVSSQEVDIFNVIFRASFFTGIYQFEYLCASKSPTCYSVASGLLPWSPDFSWLEARVEGDRPRKKKDKDPRVLDPMILKP